LLWTTGHYAEAEPLYRRSMAIREKTLGPDHPDVATSLNNLAGLLRTTGRYADAEPLYQRSLRIAQHASDPELLWNIQSSLRFFYKDAHPDLAILYGKQAVNTIQGLRANFKNDEESSKSYLETVRSVYTGLSDLLVSKAASPRPSRCLPCSRTRRPPSLPTAPWSSPRWKVACP
jgi:tetratricopeptide (TPR) repeat protein